MGGILSSTSTSHSSPSPPAPNHSVPRTISSQLKYEDTPFKFGQTFVRGYPDTSTLAPKEAATLIHLLQHLHSTDDIRITESASTRLKNHYKGVFYSRVVSICDIGPEDITVRALKKLCQVLGIGIRVTDRKQEILEYLVEWKEKHEKINKGPVRIVEPSDKNRVIRKPSTRSKPLASETTAVPSSATSWGSSTTTNTGSPRKRKRQDNESEPVPRLRQVTKILPNQILGDAIDIMQRTVEELEEKRVLLDNNNNKVGLREGNFVDCERNKVGKPMSK